MELTVHPTVACDVLIIGDGGAALRAAIEARKSNVEVLLVSRSRIGYGNNTAIAGGAVAAATGYRDPKDSPEVYFQDTIRGGRYMNHQKMVEVMAERSTEEVKNLQEYGVQFRKRNGEFSVAWLPGHTYPRTLSTVNTIGTDFTLPLINFAERVGVRFIEKVLITRLLRKGGVVAGALGLSEKGEIYLFTTKAVVLATGGLSQVFARTDNAVGTTGDGMVLAYEMGVPLADMEFVQYYPTSLGERGGRGVLYEVLVAREGGKLRNTLGEDILEKRGIREGILMTRDVVSRAIAEEVYAGRGIGDFVTLDLSSILDERLDRLAAALPRGFSRTKKTILVRPNAHFTCGGIKTDEEAKTNVEGLFAAGEVCAGVHGANRIASNAITEIFVFGGVAGRGAAEHALKITGSTPEPPDVSRDVDELKRIAARSGKENIDELRRSLRKMMWEKAGMIRSEQSLDQALADIDSLKVQIEHVSMGDYKELRQVLTLANMLTVSEMVARAAVKRTESRGVHYRIDYPESNDKRWLMNVLISKERGRMSLSTTPVLLSGFAPD